MTREITTEIRDFKHLPTVKTCADVLNMDKLKVIKSLNTKELAAAKLNIAEVVLNTVLITEPSPSKAYLSFIVDACFNFDPYKSPEEIAAILYYGSIGKYGKLYGKFTPDVLGHWFERFNEELAIERENGYYHWKAEERKRIESGLSPQEEAIKQKNIDKNKESWELVKSKIMAKSPKKYESVKEYCIAQDVNYSMFVTRWESYWRATYSNFDLRDDSGKSVLSMDEYIKMKWKQVLRRINLGKDVEPKLHENQGSRITP